MRIPIPTDEIDEPILVDESQYNRIRDYLNIPPWFCPDCNTKNFGRNENCVYCKIRKGVLVPRDSNR